MALTSTWAGTDNASAPVVLLLHGYGADEHDLTALAEYLPRGVRLASLRAPLQLPDQGFAWFPLEGIPLTAATALDEAVIGRHVAEVLAWLDDNVPAEVPLVPLGFSQGGLMVSQLLRTASDRFAGGVVCSGFVLPDPQPGDEQLATRRLRTWFGYGTADPLVSPDASAQVERVLGGLTEMTVVRRPGLGHGLDPEELASISAYLRQVLPGLA